MFNKIIAAAVLLTGVCAAPAVAQEWYVGGAIGINTQSDSDNSGKTGAFTTGDLGDGSTLDVASGTPYGWTTEFDSGASYSVEAGLRYGSNLRSGIEITSSSADVDTHKNVTLGGGSIDALDAASIASSPTPLGVTVADVVADGRGDLTMTAVYANAYYEFETGSAFKPYVGAGLGYADIDVDYSPSGIGVISESESKLAYQVKAGASYMLENSWELYGEYAYRATDDVELNNELFPGTLSIENKQNVFSIGARYRFGG